MKIDSDFENCEYLSEEVLTHALKFFQEFESTNFRDMLNDLSVREISSIELVSLICSVNVFVMKEWLFCHPKSPAAMYSAMLCEVSQIQVKNHAYSFIREKISEEEADAWEDSFNDCFGCVSQNCYDHAVDVKADDQATSDERSLKVRPADENQRNNELLFECYLSGGIEENQWQEHLKDEVFAKWVEENKDDRGIEK